MKKTLIITTTAVLAIAGLYVVAQAQTGEPQKKAAGQDTMSMCPMHMTMCKGMMERQMTALEDGGIVVLAANQLIKYDSNLNLVKQTELKVDMPQMQEQMKKMMRNCPMCQKMMQQKSSGDASDEHSEHHK